MNTQPENPSPEPAQTAPLFSRAPGETPRAFNAFAAYFELGHDRSLRAVADQLGENETTVRNWSSKYNWNARIHAFQSGLLQQQAQAQAARQLEHAADWSRRSRELRELQWANAQKLLAAAQCFLESFGEKQLEEMNLSGVARAMHIGSQIAQEALRPEAVLDDSSTLSPIQMELEAALKRIYALPTPPNGAVPSAGSAGATPATQTAPAGSEPVTPAQS